MRRCGARQFEELGDWRLFGDAAAVDEYDFLGDASGLAIGAGTILHTLSGSEVVRQRAPVLAEAAGKVASQQIRNVATQEVSELMVAIPFLRIDQEFISGAYDVSPNGEAVVFMTAGKDVDFVKPIYTVYLTRLDTRPLTSTRIRTDFQHDLASASQVPDIGFESEGAVIKLTFPSNSIERYDSLTGQLIPPVLEG